MCCCCLWLCTWPILGCFVYQRNLHFLSFTLSYLCCCFLSDSQTFQYSSYPNIFKLLWKHTHTVFLPPFLCVCRVFCNTICYIRCLWSCSDFNKEEPLKGCDSANSVCLMQHRKLTRITSLFIHNSYNEVEYIFIKSIAMIVTDCHNPKCGYPMLTLYLFLSLKRLATQSIMWPSPNST